MIQRNRKYCIYFQHSVHWDINCSFLAPSHLLKITKFLVKISQCIFLVMTEKNIFVYKLFQILVYFLCKNCKTHHPPYPSAPPPPPHTHTSSPPPQPLPPEKGRPLFPSNPPLKIEILSSPLFENPIRGSKHPSRPRPHPHQKKCVFCTLCSLF